MALRDEIQTIVSTLLPVPTFFFGTELEFNNAADNLDYTNGCFFMYSLQQVGFQSTINKSVSNQTSIFVAMLYKAEFEGVNSNQAEPLDKKAISMLNQFFIRLQEFRGDNGAKVFKINSGQKAKPKAVNFNYADVNLYGRSFALDLDTFANEKICY